MVQEKENISFYVLNGSVEILKSLENSNKPVQFKQLRELVNPITLKKFSSSTIAQRLKELEDRGTVGHEIIAGKGRKIVGYKITPVGKKTLTLLRETEARLEKLK